MDAHRQTCRADVLGVDPRAGEPRERPWISRQDATWSGAVNLAGKRIATYARFSTDKQSAESTAHQIAKSERWCVANGGRLSAALIFRDDAVSGAVRDRPGLVALMSAVTSGQVDVVVVEDLGRLSRDTEDSAGIRKRIAYAGVRLVALDDGIDSTSEGAELMGDVMASFKSLFRRDCAKKTLRGMEGRARAGHATGCLAIGYRSVLRPDGAHDIAIDEDGARIVREIFRLYAEGRSLDAVAQNLNERGVAPPRGGRSRGEWLTSSIRAVLHNEKYVGRWSFGVRQWRRDPDTQKRTPRARTTPIVVQERPELAIVDSATWEAVRARFASSGVRYAGASKRIPRAPMKWPLSGLLHCGTCGSLWTICGGERDRRYYMCSASRRGGCAEKSFHRETRVRAAVLGSIRARFGGADGLAMVEALITEEAATMSGAGDERRNLVAKIARDEQALSSLMRTIERLVDDAPDAMVERVRELGAAVKSGKHALARLAADENVPRAELPSAEDVLGALTDALDGPPAVVREALRRMLDGGRLDVVRRPDGSMVVRGGLLPDTLIFPGSPATGPDPSCFAEARFELTTFGL